MKKLRNLIGMAAILLATAFSSVAATNSVTLAWDPNPPTDAVVKYNVYTSTVGSTDGLAVQSTTGTNIVVTNLFMGKTYNFYATAVNNAHLESEPSDVIQFYMPFVLPDIKITSILFGGKQGNDWNNVEVKWDNIDKIKYASGSYTLKVTDLSLSGPSYTFDQLSNNAFTIPTLPVADYKLSVTTTNWHGESQLSEAFISKAPPTKPRIFLQN